MKYLKILIWKTINLAKISSQWPWANYCCSSIFLTPFLTLTPKDNSCRLYDVPISPPPIDLQAKSVNSFLYDRDLRHERVNSLSTHFKPISPPISVPLFDASSTPTKTRKMPDKQLMEYIYIKHFINNC